MFLHLSLGIQAEVRPHKNKSVKKYTNATRGRNPKTARAAFQLRVHGALFIMPPIRPVSGQRKGHGS
jgi:hypothetical protein